MTGTLAPSPILTLLDADGASLVAGKLYTYLAGTSTPVATYTDSTLSVANANPIIADAAGRVEVWLSPGVSYKFICQNSASVEQWSVDDIDTVPAANLALDIEGTAGEALLENDCVYLSDGSPGTAGRWYKADATYTYASTSASVIAFVPAAIASGASGTIRLQGRVTGMSGLTPGDIYYVSTTPGLITPTAPANTVFVGAADSTTSIVVQPSSNATAGLDARVTVLEGESTDLFTAVGGVNLIRDSSFLIWAGGDAVAPTCWTVSGGAAAAARETSIIKIGPMCAKLTAAAAEGLLLQELMPAATYDDWLEGTDVSMGAWVYATVASKIRICISSSTTSYSSYHTGGSTWEWLTVSHTVGVGATTIKSGLAAVIGAVGYISGPTLLIGSAAPTKYQPSPCEVFTISFSNPGSLTVASQILTYVPYRPALVKHVQLHAKGTPGTQPLIVDVNSWNGSAFVSLFTNSAAQPQIAAGEIFGSATPSSSTYSTRCLSARASTTPTTASAGQLIAYDIDQLGIAGEGSNLTVYIRCLQFTSPMEAFYGPTEIV